MGSRPTKNKNTDQNVLLVIFQFSYQDLMTCHF